jgi:nucleoside-diphosphate-sugar epimerase
VRILQADINDEAAVEKLLAGTQWDCVCDFIGFVPAQVERDWRLFKGRTKQYMYISSASAYQKPAASPFITEGTPLVNPYWQYSRDKIACEDFLMEKHRIEGFPVTIIRPSHTYDERPYLRPSRTAAPGPGFRCLVRPGHRCPGDGEGFAPLTVRPPKRAFRRKNREFRIRRSRFFLIFNPINNTRV